MHYQFIPWLLDQEQNADFQSVGNKWRPKRLLQLRQVQLLLKDIAGKKRDLELARDEFKTLEYADRYLKYLRRMRLWVRDASFSSRADQLKFLVSVVGFYSDYGAMLKMMRIDALRGQFQEEQSSESTTL